MLLVDRSQMTSLGKGGCNWSSQNPGIVKKGGGGSDPCQHFFGGFNIVHRGQLKVIIDPEE